MGRKHPLSEERSKNRTRLRKRNKPDYCYSEGQNKSSDVPEYNGPWQEEIPDFYYSNNPRDDGYLNPLDELEECIETYHGKVGAR